MQARLGVDDWKLPPGPSETLHLLSFADFNLDPFVVIKHSHEHNSFLNLVGLSESWKLTVAWGTLAHIYV